MSRRLEKINELLKEEIGKIFLREIDVEPGVFLTVTRVETREDLREANVYISVWPAEKRAELFRRVQRSVSKIQRRLNKTLRMHPVPKIAFELDRALEEADRVEELIEKAKEDFARLRRVRLGRKN